MPVGSFGARRTSYSRQLAKEQLELLRNFQDFIVAAKQSALSETVLTQRCAETTRVTKKTMEFTEFTEFRVTK